MIFFANLNMKWSKLMDLQFWVYTGFLFGLDSRIIIAYFYWGGKNFVVRMSFMRLIMYVRYPCGVSLMYLFVMLSTPCAFFRFQFKYLFLDFFFDFFVIIFVDYCVILFSMFFPSFLSLLLGLVLVLLIGPYCIANSFFPVCCCWLFVFVFWWIF